MESIYFTRVPSPAGPLLLALSSRGLMRLEFDRGRHAGCNGQDWQESASALDPWTRQRALLDIPYGETCSYRDIAKAIAHPHAFRAVGMSNNRNPIAIVVPCHRVIASDGSLCGYGGGLDIKRKLLDLEQTHSQPSLRLGIGA